MKRGYTTGSTAAAACKGAVKTLFTGLRHESVEIDTPIGIPLKIPVNYIEITKEFVEVFATKDFSDDPDVTKGIKIYVHARRVSDPGIYIKTGAGVGTVTKKGLRVPVGEPAINPVPMSMIISEIDKVLPEHSGVEVTISIPDGVEIAKKTFNSKLGIVGGISILGTTGIVEPMSEDAFKQSLKLEMSVLVEDGCRSDLLIFVFGNFGRDYLKTYNVNNSYIIKTSNFIGFMLEAAGEIGVKRVLLVGHAGKMVKVANAMYNTHSKYGDGRMKSILNSCSGLSAIEEEKILNSNTTDEAIGYLKDLLIDSTVFKDIGRRCIENLEGWSGNRVKVETIIFTTVFGEISSSNNAHSWIKEMVDD